MSRFLFATLITMAVLLLSACHHHHRVYRVPAGKVYRIPPGHDPFGPGNSENAPGHNKAFKKHKKHKK